MEQEYISIKDFANKANVSVQSIYKRLNGLNNLLNQYVKLVDNQKMLNIKALQEVYGIEVEQPIQPNDSTNSTFDSTNSTFDSIEKQIHSDMKNDILELENKYLKEKIQLLEEEKADWKAQITILNRRLDESQKLLNQQQQLCAISQKKIEELEQKEEKEKEKKAWWKFWA